MSDYQYQRGINNSFVFQGDMDALKEANDLLTGKEWYYHLGKQLRHYDFTEDEKLYDEVEKLVVSWAANRYLTDNQT